MDFSLTHVDWPTFNKLSGEIRHAIDTLAYHFGFAGILTIYIMPHAL